MSDIRLIDANKLKEKFLRNCTNCATRCFKEICADCFIHELINEIDNAPTVEPEITDDDVKGCMTEAFKNGYEMAKAKFERPKGEREFIEIFAEYRNDDYDTLPEYRGKPYYSIHYRENGEEFVGYGTYKIEVLSRYLRDYFFGADMRGDEK